MGIQRGLLRSQGQGDAAAVSATPQGREFAKALIAAIHTALTPAAEELLVRISEQFRERLQAEATDLAVKSGRPNVEPLHIILAAKTLVAGSMAEKIIEIDSARDKTSDRAAEDSLLELLFRSDGSDR